MLWHIRFRYVDRIEKDFSFRSIVAPNHDIRFRLDERLSSRLSLNGDIGRI
jgi:hypothetical protein